MKDPILHQLTRLADAFGVQNAANQAWIETQVRWHAEDTARMESLFQQNQTQEKALEVLIQQYHDDLVTMQQARLTKKE